jgi:hypothetical protein
MKTENVRKKEEERKKSLWGNAFRRRHQREREHSNGGVPLLLSSVSVVVVVVVVVDVVVCEKGVRVLFVTRTRQTSFFFRGRSVRKFHPFQNLQDIKISRRLRTRRRRFRRRFRRRRRFSRISSRFSFSLFQFFFSPPADSALSSLRHISTPQVTQNARKRFRPS